MQKEVKSGRWRISYTLYGLQCELRDVMLHGSQELKDGGVRFFTIEFKNSEARYRLEELKNAIDKFFASVSRKP